MKRSGFTLMELLLVVAILAIVAAVAAPQFFRASDIAMADSRIALLKANYSAVKAAVNMGVWDETNNKTYVAPYILRGTGAAKDGTIKLANSRMRILLDRGLIQENAGFVENKKGEKLFLAVKMKAAASNLIPSNPYTVVASTPIFMEESALFEVHVVDKAGSSYNVDDQLRLTGGGNWPKIWDDIKGFDGL